MNSSNITVTDARVLENLSKVNNVLNNDKTTKVVKEEVDNAKLKTGVIEKYYIHLNKAEVKLDDSNKIVTCRILQSFCNEFTIKYTPEGDFGYDEVSGTAYVIPRSKMECVVLPTSKSSKDTDYFLIGYFNSDNTLDLITAPTMGNIKLSYVSVTDEYLVQFGANGFNVITNHLNQYEGVESEYKKPIDDLATIETLEKDYYTKEEVDELINNLRNELQGDDDVTTE